MVDATGDNALAEFPTALDAVEAAVEIQGVLRRLAARSDAPHAYRADLHTWMALLAFEAR